MAFVACPKCGVKVSDKAEKCFKCGKDLTEAEPPKPSKPVENRKAGSTKSAGYQWTPKSKLAVSCLALFAGLVVIGTIGQALDPVKKPLSEPVRRSAPLWQIPRSAYERIQEGMTLAEAEAIIGRDGEERSSSEFGDTKTALYSWQDEAGGNINVTVQNGKIVSKAQFGLH